MKLFHYIRNLKQHWNSLVKHQLRRVGIFKRLNISFLLLLLISALFLTFFSFNQYSTEINLNLDRHSSLLVQNVVLKIQDIMKEYESLALRFYDDSETISAISANALLSENGSPQEQEQFLQNTYLIENKLYNMRFNRKYIVNIQFVTPTHQYHMVEPNGFQRGGTIRDLDLFYESEFYLLPQEKNGYPVWMDSELQTDIFYKDKQSIYGLANIITMGVAVYEPVSRNFLGVLLFNIDLNTFSGAIESYDAYNDGNTFLTGKNGVLTWFSPSISAPSYPQDPDLFSQMLETDQSVIRINTNERRLLLAYQKIPGTQIFASYIADLDVLLKNAYQIRNLCILVLICTVIACFVISYYVTISISDPIHQLIHVMHKTGNGKWTARYENSGHDEITTLGDCFNEMAEKINQLFEQVYLSEIRRQRTLLSWKNAQLDAMLMQINPHFLYNTLDIIRWEAMYEANGESPVTQMIEKFSLLCRMGMRTDGNTIRLSEGIEHASIYMEVINFRHNDKIQLLIETDVDANALYIPQFMLQPILENAVVHAFGGASKGYSIKIHSLSDNENLHIIVEDNGCGMTPEELEVLNQSLSHSEITDKGIGLVNVNQRIRLFYGEAYGIQITSTPEKGTQIKITLPLREHSENMTNNTGGNPNL